MTISIIIPTYNAQEHLPTLLEKLKKQTATFELIIIDSSSTDATIDIAKAYTSHILTIPTHTFDHGGTRTKAAQTASGEIIIFLTQDALPYDEMSIQTIANSFENASIGAAYGRQIPYATSTLFGKHLRHFNYTNTSYTRTLADTKTYGIKTGFLSDSFAAYRKTALQQIGWFKDGLIVGEDSYAGSKLLLEGYGLHYNAEAKVYHSHSYTCVEDFKRYFDIGVFHSQESWIPDTFGRAEGEGKRYIKAEFKYLLSHKAYYLIPKFFIRNGLKYLGYKLGQKYHLIPKKIIKKLSMHANWW